MHLYATVTILPWPLSAFPLVQSGDTSWIPTPGSHPDPSRFLPRSIRYGPQDRDTMLIQPALEPQVATHCLYGLPSIFGSVLRAFLKSSAPTHPLCSSTVNLVLDLGLLHRPSSFLPNESGCSSNATSSRASLALCAFPSDTLAMCLTSTSCFIPTLWGKDLLHLVPPSHSLPPVLVSVILLT